MKLYDNGGMDDNYADRGKYLLTKNKYMFLLMDKHDSHLLDLKHVEKRDNLMYFSEVIIK